MFRQLAKAGAFTLFGSDPAIGAKLRRIAASGALTILNLHRVDGAHLSAYEALSPRIFDELIGWLKARFQIMRFAELDVAEASNRPPLILSFDDGYLDFAEIVAPILEKHGLAANQNVVPACVESGLPPANVLVQDFIGQAPAALLAEVPFPGFIGRVDPSARVRDGLRISSAIKRRPIAEQRVILAGLVPHFARFDSFRPTPMMGAATLRQLTGTHEIGAHSFEHATMTAETNAYLAEDMVRCRRWFSETLGLRPSVYAFPNGACRPGQAEAVHAAGFKHVLLVGNGFSRPLAWCHHRFNFHAQSSCEARFRATGGFVRAT